MTRRVSTTRATASKPRRARLQRRGEDSADEPPASPLRCLAACQAAHVALFACALLLCALVAHYFRAPLAAAQAGAAAAPPPSPLAPALAALTDSAAAAPLSLPSPQPLPPPLPLPSPQLQAQPPARFTPAPWFKLDYVIPLCWCPGCCDSSLWSANTYTAYENRAALAVGDATSPLFAGVERGFASTFLRLSDALAILSAARAVPPPAGGVFIVNIGAACGLGGIADPTFTALLDANVSAVLIDGQSKAELFAAYPARPNVRVVGGESVEPATIAALLTRERVPSGLSVLKVDVDSWDLGLVEAVLNGGFRPRLVYMEINTCFPPPIRFTVDAAAVPRAAEYAPPLWQVNAPFFGVSLASADDLLRARGYALLEVDGFDAMWVDSALRAPLEPLPDSAEAAFAAGFSRRRDAFPHCHNPAQLPKVYDVRIAELVADVAAAQRAGRPVEPALRGIREYIEPFAPKDAMGQPYPYKLSAAGGA